MMRGVLWKNFKNGFDLILLMRSGIDGFPDDVAAARQSFLAPLALFPLTMVFAVFQPPIGMDDLALWRIELVLSIHMVISWCLFLLVVYWLSGVMERRAHFFRFVSAYNWATAAYSVTVLPFLPLRAFDVLSQSDMYVFGTILALYGYVVTGFILWRVFLIPLALASALSIAGMFIAETLWDLIYLTQGLPPPP